MRDAVGLLRALVAEPTVSNRPVLGLAALLAERAEARGLRATVYETSPGKVNVVARGGPEGVGGLTLCGHMDVVPPDGQDWSRDPFVLHDDGERLYGRGACDMKGGIAAFIAGLSQYLDANPDHPGSISLLITGDEEARSVDGTAKVLEWMEANGQIPDMALVGEPTSKRVLGDIIKIGRRGSLNAWVTIEGKQGHSAYPAAADNPIHRMVAALAPLLAAPLDNGTPHFPPSTLQVTGFDVGNTTSNVIPATARAMINIRFNDLHTSAHLIERLHAAFRAAGARYTMETACSGESFLTAPGPFVQALSDAIAQSTGVTPTLDTGGGTSDARFIARYCPVAEFGAVGETMSPTFIVSYRHWSVCA